MINSCSLLATCPPKNACTYIVVWVMLLGMNKYGVLNAKYRHYCLECLKNTNVDYQESGITFPHAASCVE